MIKMILLFAGLRIDIHDDEAILGMKMAEEFEDLNYDEEYDCDFTWNGNILELEFDGEVLTCEYNVINDSITISKDAGLQLDYDLYFMKKAC